MLAASGYNCHRGARRAKDVWDVVGPFVYQCKLRRWSNAYLLERDWLRGIVAAGERSGGATGVVPVESRRTPATTIRLWRALKRLQGLGILAWRVRVILKREKPAGSESGGPFDSVRGSDSPRYGRDTRLEHTTGLDPSATGDLVNSKTQEIHDAEI